MVQMIAVKSIGAKRSQWLTFEDGHVAMTASRLCASKFLDGFVDARYMETLRMNYPDYTFTLYAVKEN